MSYVLVTVDRTEGTGISPMATDEYRFKPGVSGNPAGRPKMLPHIKAFAEGCAMRMLSVLIEIAEDKTERGITRLGAANSVLDRGLGKAIQQIHVNPMFENNDVRTLTTQVLEKIVLEETTQTIDADKKSIEGEIRSDVKSKKK